MPFLLPLLFLGEGSSTKIDDRKKGVPFSNLCRPSFGRFRRKKKTPTLLKTMFSISPGGLKRELVTSANIFFQGA